MSSSFPHTKTKEKTLSSTEWDLRLTILRFVIPVVIITVVLLLARRQVKLVTRPRYVSPVSAYVAIAVLTPLSALLLWASVSPPALLSAAGLAAVAVFVTSRLRKTAWEDELERRRQAEH